jgi:hypothetical protein
VPAATTCGADAAVVERDGDCSERVSAGGLIELMIGRTLAAKRSACRHATLPGNSPDDDADIRAYGARLLSILEARWPLAEGERNELDPPVVTIASDALASWRAFYDHVEERCGVLKEFDPIHDLASKAAEHAVRTGILTIVSDVHATGIGGEATSSEPDVACHAAEIFGDPKSSGTPCPSRACRYSRLQCRNSAGGRPIRRRSP